MNLPEITTEIINHLDMNELSSFCNTNSSIHNICVKNKEISFKLYVLNAMHNTHHYPLTLLYIFNNPRMPLIDYTHKDTTLTGNKDTDKVILKQFLDPKIFTICVLAVNIPITYVLMIIVLD